MIDQNRKLYVCFIDYEKAFDRVTWNRLFPLLENLGIENKIIKLIKNLYQKQEAIVSIEEELTEPVHIKRGVRQGCLLSPGLFNAYSEMMMERALWNQSGGIWINGERINSIKFADNHLLYQVQ